MKKVLFILSVVLICGAVAVWALTPVETSPKAHQGQIPALPETTALTGITCTFDCADGYGFLLECQDPTLGECCQHGEPACAEHGGLEDGICWKGRLGLPCTGI